MSASASPSVQLSAVDENEQTKGGGGEGGGGEGGGATDVAAVASVSSTPTRQDGILPATREDDLPTRPVARGVQQGLGREP